METVVIKIDAKTKVEKSSLLTSVGEIIIRILTFWIPRASPDYERNLKYVNYWHVEIDKNSGAPEREIGFDQVKTAILFAPTDKNFGFWTDSSATFNWSDHELVDKEIFNDIFESLEKYDITFVEEKINKYLLLWTKNPNIKTPEFPILIYNDSFSDVLICNTVEQLLNTNVTGYEWGDRNCIDMTGAVYSTNYINFGHPVGCVVPERIEKILNLDEFKSTLSGKFKKHEREINESKTYEVLFKILNKTD